MAEQTVPLKISIAPFPEGFSGDMDETFQQACQLMEATVEGSFLTGLILPPGSTLPSSDVGPIAMDGVWYFWDPVTEQYLPQSISARPAINFVKNSIYQVRQTGDAPTVGAGVNRTYDMVITRSTAGTILSIAADAGPTATPDHDTCQSAIKYTVTNPVVSPAATDFYAHEHVIEGSDIAPIQGEILSLSFLCWVNQPGTYSVYLTNDARDASYVATFAMSAASTWARVKIENIPAIPIGTGTWSFSEGTTGVTIGIPFCLGSQWQTVSANLKTWQGGFFAGIATQTNMCAVSNNQMKITAVRLEASPQAGYASVNSFDADYQDCIRYYYTTFNYQSFTTGVGITGNAHVANNSYFAFAFPRRMAKVPTVVPYGWASHTAGNITNLSTGADFAVATLTATAKGICGNPAPTATAKGDVLIACITADARL